MENILITGITGQDGVFLTKNLIDKNENIFIHGVSRSNDLKTLERKLMSLGVLNFTNLKIHNINLEDKKSVRKLIKTIKPDRIFNLTGPSSVYDSFSNPKKVINTITGIFDNLTETLIEENIFVNFFQASSSEIFAPINNESINEEAKMSPNSPYAEAKKINHDKVSDLIEKYNWNITSGIMFNHESEFREDNYLTSKIIKDTFDIYKNNKQEIVVGSLDYVRDWSFAGDIMKAASTLSFNNAKGPYIIGSGEGNSIKELIRIVFSYFDLDWEKYTRVDEDLLRKGDPIIKISNPYKIFKDFGWKTEMSFEDLIIRCIENKIKVME